MIFWPTASAIEEHKYQKYTLLKNYTEVNVMFN